MAIVPPPTGDPDAPLGVLTGSEDGTVLRAVYTRERVARSPGEVGQHFAGAGVRAVRVVPERPGGGLGGAVPGVEDAPSSPPASYLLITAGAKEVIQAWRVRWSRSAAPAPGERSGAWELRATLAAARGGAAKPGHAEWTKGCGGLRASVASDQRYMDVTAYVPAMKEPRPSLRGSAASSDSERTGSNRADSSAACVALAASSDGSVAAFALLESGGGGGGGGGGGDAARRRGRARGGAAHRGGWRLAATLRHHTRPALSLAVLGVALDRGPRGSLATVAFTGATDGELAAWDLTALEDHLGPGPEPDGLGGDANARARRPLARARRALPAGAPVWGQRHRARAAAAGRGRGGSRARRERGGRPGRPRRARRRARRDGTARTGRGERARRRPSPGREGRRRSRERRRHSEASASRSWAFASSRSRTAPR